MIKALKIMFLIGMLVFITFAFSQQSNTPKNTVLETNYSSLNNCETATNAETLDITIMKIESNKITFLYNKNVYTAPILSKDYLAIKKQLFDYNKELEDLGYIRYSLTQCSYQVNAKLELKDKNQLLSNLKETDYKILKIDLNSLKILTDGPLKQIYDNKESIKIGKLYNFDIKNSTNFNFLYQNTIYNLPLSKDNYNLITMKYFSDNPIFDNPTVILQVDKDINIKELTENDFKIINVLSPNNPFLNILAGALLIAIIVFFVSILCHD